MTPYAEVIGDPIGHSKSPLIHNFWLQKLGLAGDYRRTQVRPDELAAFLAQRREDSLWRGCNVTMPLKLAVTPLLDKHRDPAASTEPINLVVRENGCLHGTNTDVFGVLEPLRARKAQRLKFVGEQGMDEPRRAVVLGSGGVLHSAVRALKSLGYWPITVVARSEAKVRELLGASGAQLPFLTWGSPLPSCYLLVNATPLGMAGHGPLPYDASSVVEGGIVFEMIYQPLVTPLVADARARGRDVVDGLEMLVAQASPSFERLFGAATPRQHDRELRALLTA